MIPAEVLTARVCHIEIPNVCIEPSVAPMQSTGIPYSSCKIKEKKWNVSY